MIAHANKTVMTVQSRPKDIQYGWGKRRLCFHFTVSWV